MSRLVSQHCDSVLYNKCEEIFDVLGQPSVLLYVQDSIEKEVSHLPTLRINEQQAVVSTVVFLHKLKLVLNELTNDRYPEVGASTIQMVANLLIADRKRLNKPDVDEKSIFDRVDRHLHEKTGNFISKRERSVSYHILYDYFLAFISSGCDAKSPSSMCPNVIMDFKISMIAFSLLWKNDSYPFVLNKPERSDNELVDKKNIETQSELFMESLVSERKLFTTDLEIKLLSNFLSVSAIIWQKYVGVTHGYAPFHPVLSSSSVHRKSI